MTLPRPRLAWLPTALGLSAGILITVALGSGAGSQTTPDPDPSRAPIPDLGRHLTDPSKTFLVGLEFNGREQVTTQSVQVIPGSTRLRGADPDLLRVQTFDLADQPVEDFGAWHPLWTYVYGEDGREHLEIEESATGYLSMPFRSDLKTVKVTDVGLGKEVASISLEEPIREFCAANREDPACLSDLTVAKAASPDPATPGRDLTYTVTVTNKGPNPAYANRVIDTLPEGVVHRSDTAGCTKESDLTLSCDVGLIPADQSASFTVTVGVDSDLANRVGGHAPTIANEVTVVHRVGAESAGTSADNTSMAVTRLVEVADLAVTKTDVGDPVVAGRTANYTLSVSNPSGPSTASRVRLRDMLPEGLSYVPGSPGCSSSGQIVTCEIGVLRVGESRQLNIEVRVDSNLVFARAGGGSTTITNEAEVENVDGHDETPGNNTVSETTTVVEEADVGVVKSDVADPVAAGTPIGYHFRVTNETGPSTASKVTLTDSLPDGVTFVTSTGACSPVAPGSRRVDCQVGAMLVGESREFTITGHVDADLVRARGGFGFVNITNEATVENSGGPDPNPSNNNEPEETRIIEVADLSVTKSDAPDPVGAGTELGYTLTVSNAGPSTASRARIVDALPPAVEHRSDTGHCDATPGEPVVCELGAISVGQSRQVSMRVLVDENTVCRAGGPVAITNAATVENPGATDSDEGNNRRSEDTRVVDNQVRGSAFAERLRVRLALLFGVSSGPAPMVSSPNSGCGPFRESQSMVSAPGTDGVVSVRGMTATVNGDRSGPDAFVHSQADVADAALALAGISFEGVRSECTSNEAGSTASTSIGRLVVAGRASVNLAPAPNTQIPIPGVGVLVLNEQVRTDSPPTATEFGRSSVVVTAVQLKTTILGLVDADVVLAESSCSIEGLHVLR